MGSTHPRRPDEGVRAVWPGRDATTEALTPDYRRGPGSESFVCINRSSTFVIRFCFSTNRLSSGAMSLPQTAHATGLGFLKSILASTVERNPALRLTYSRFLPAPQLGASSTPERCHALASRALLERG
jgi:hypothetical protein